MIADVQVRNVQKSRSGLTRMAKLTFEDLTGSIPAMLWPEEFAKIEALVKNDLIGFVRGTLDRRRDPAELIVTPDHPARAGAAPSCRAGWSSRSARGSPGRAAREPAPRRSGSGPGTSTSTSRSSAWSRSAARSTRRARRCKIRHDDRLFADLESAVGAGNVRLLGQRGATTRIDAGPPGRDDAHRAPARSLVAAGIRARPRAR